MSFCVSPCASNAPVPCAPQAPLEAALSAHRLKRGKLLIVSAQARMDDAADDAPPREGGAAGGGKPKTPCSADGCHGGGDEPACGGAEEDSVDHWLQRAREAANGLWRLW